MLLFNQLSSIKTYHVTVSILNFGCGRSCVVITKIVENCGQMQPTQPQLWLQCSWKRTLSFALEPQKEGYGKGNYANAMVLNCGCGCGCIVIPKLQKLMQSIWQQPQSAVMERLWRPPKLQYYGCNCSCGLQFKTLVMLFKDFVSCKIVQKHLVYW